MNRRNFFGALLAPGLVMVGREGPEKVVLRGERVIPPGEAPSPIMHFNVESVDPEKFATRIREELMRQLQRGRRLAR